MKNKFEEARNRYRPKSTKLLLIAEAPPREDLGRFFYFENVKNQDSLFIETMKVLYPTYYTDAKTVRKSKGIFLDRFMKDGYYLLDAASSPILNNRNKNKQIKDDFPQLLNKINSVINESTKIILISRSVYDVCFEALKSKGYKIINTEMIDFPGSGSQIKFRNKMQPLLKSV